MAAAKNEKPAGRGERPLLLPLWKKVLLALCALFLLVGFSLRFLPSSEEASGSGGSALSAQSSGGASEAEPQEEGFRSFAPFFVKGGFSFFLGFCLGLALRAFFKVSAVVIGLFALALFGLSYSGVVEVDWARIEEWYEAVVGRVRAEAGGFKAFVTGSLPAAGLATLGLIAGFKR